MGPYDFLRAQVPFGFIPFLFSFLISFLKTFYVIIYKVMKPNKATLKKILVF